MYKKEFETYGLSRLRFDKTLGKPLDGGWLMLIDN